MKKVLLTLFIVLILVTGFIVYRLDQMSLKADQIIDMTFTSDHDLKGSLYLPKEDGPYDVVFFIHGDGPANRTLDGNYHFIMNALLDAGYACFSYDKAGIGHSSGNWLDQTMKDRAREVLEGLSVIRETVDVKSIGVLAFSQGGWVTSELALMDAKLDFYMVIGGAIDWMDQHIYYETQYAKRMGYSEEETINYLDYIKTGDDFISANDYEGYLKHVTSHDYEEPMSKERFNFAYLNHEANSRQGISKIQVPFLGLFGEQDLNVHVKESISVYKEEFEMISKTNYELHLIPNATHALLDSAYNEKSDDLFLHAFLKGDGIYAEGVFELMVNWLDERLE